MSSNHGYAAEEARDPLVRLLSQRLQAAREGIALVVGKVRIGRVAAGQALHKDAPRCKGGDALSILYARAPRGEERAWRLGGSSSSPSSAI